MKKLCFVTTISSTLDSFVSALAEKLLDDGKYEITFVSGDQEQSKCSFDSRIKQKSIIMRRGVSFSGLYSIYLLYIIFKNENYDAVIYATPNAALYASVASYFAKTPTRLYNQWGIRYVGFKGVKRKLFKLLEKITCILSTDIRVASNMNRIFSISENLYSERKSKVIGKGGTIGVEVNDYIINIENDVKLKEKYGIDEKFIYGFIGRMTIDKGIIELLEAFKRVINEFDDVHLVIVGNSEVADSKHAIFKWARCCPHITFTGEQDNKDIAQFYNLFDVFVHPTYREGFGLVLQEAGAAGLPIITTRVPGASEVFVHGESCMLVGSKNITELFLQMKELKTNHNLRQKLSENSLKEVIEHYSRQHRLDLLVRDINGLLSDKVGVK